MATKTGIRLKILVDTKSQRVVFAEAGKDFVDFLFHISYLPVGTVMKLIADHGASGCLNNIYQSIEKFSDTMMLPSRKKDDMLKPMCVTFTESDLQTLPKIQTSTSSTFHMCGKSNTYTPIATNGVYNSCSICGNFTNIARKVREPTKGCSSEMKGYVKRELTYMVMDNLLVRPAQCVCSIDMVMDDLTVRLVSAISSDDAVNGFDIKNAGILEAREVQLGDENALKLLKASIQSKTVLN